MKITRGRLSELFELIFDIGELTKSVKDDPYVFVLYSNLDGTLEVSVNTNGFQKPMEGFDKKYSFDLNGDILKTEWTQSWTDDPERDYERYASDIDDRLASLPKCWNCGEPIQQEDAVYFSGGFICDNCLEEIRREIE